MKTIENSKIISEWDYKKNIKLFHTYESEWIKSRVFGLTKIKEFTGEDYG